jgi:hypothetical protein
MKTVKTTSVILVLVMLLASCQKKSELSARELQLKNEMTQPLLAHEILEQEGVRFILNYSQSNAQISLKLDGQPGEEGFRPALSADQPYVNYFVEANKLAENSDYIISVSFANVTNSGSYDLSIIGFTDLNKSKIISISNNAFAPADNQTSRLLLKVHKGIRKFSFYKL